MILEDTPHIQKNMYDYESNKRIWQAYDIMISVFDWDKKEEPVVQKSIKNVTLNLN